MTDVAMPAGAVDVSNWADVETTAELHRPRSAVWIQGTQLRDGTFESRCIRVGGLHGTTCSTARMLGRSRKHCSRPPTASTGLQPLGTKPPAIPASYLRFGPPPTATGGGADLLYFGLDAGGPGASDVAVVAVSFSWS